MVDALVTFGDAMVSTSNYTVVFNERDATFKLAFKSATVALSYPSRLSAARNAKP